MSNNILKLSALVLLTLCSIGANIAYGENSAVSVAVTAPVLAPLVESIGGSHVSIYQVIPQGADPHTYEPPASFAARLNDFDVIVMTGPHHLRVEEVILNWKRQGLLRHPIIVYYGNYTLCGLEPLNISGHLNPHGYWWGPHGLAAVARCVGKALAVADPAHSGYYLARASLYAAQAEALADRLQGLRLAAYSPVVQYFAVESGASIVYTAALSPDSEPRPYAAQVVDTLYRNGSIDAFVVTAIDTMLSRAAAEMVSELRASGGPVALITLGAPGGDPLRSVAESQGMILQATTQWSAPVAEGTSGGCVQPWGVGVASFMAGLVVAVAWWRSARA